MCKQHIYFIQGFAIRPGNVYMTWFKLIKSEALSNNGILVIETL